jgi:hypothetical protein
MRRFFCVGDCLHDSNGDWKMIGAYQGVVDFAYPGWRLTVPGGPAGGHYKGFTHTQAAGTTILPEDDYETDRGDGMSSHDAVHASQRNPRGVYRSSGEVPPRPNASGSAHTYRGFQTRRHAGTSVAPGSFPADYKETGEDDFLSLAENAVHYFTPKDAISSLLGMGLVARESFVGDGPVSEMVPYRPGGYGSIGPILYQGGPLTYTPPNTVAAPATPPTAITPVVAAPPSTGATSTVNQPPGTLAPAPPSPAIPVYTAPPVSPAPAPTVATNEVVPLNDGSGNYINLSTGQTIPASAVTQNLATMQLTAAPGSSAGIMSWLEQPSAIYPSIPNWGLVAAAAVAASMLMGKRR